MKFTKAAIKTTKEPPKDADSANARFLVQGGFIHKELAGVYSFLPLGKRVLKKIEKIIREEMDAIDSQEVSMTALTPLENWKKTGRDHVPIAYLPTPNTVLGWSHEEIVTPIGKEYISSWKDLPLSLYQIQTKFRNEPRAKAGILRGREFLMKDMYSFHDSQEDLDAYYQKTLEAYLRVYERCHLTAYAIEASGGVFTKKISHEFAVLTESGEDVVIFEKDTKGNLINPQNSEIAVGVPPDVTFKKEADLKEMVEKGPMSIADTASKYGIGEHEMLRPVVLVIEDGGKKKFVGISIRGDLRVNTHKVMQYFGTEDIRSATSEELREHKLAEGFISPVKNNTLEFYADESVKKMVNFCAGANKMNVNYLNCNIGLDCKFKDIFDFLHVTMPVGTSNPQGGFTSKKTGNPLYSELCIEAGNIFDLGTKYSEAFDVKYLDKEGKHQYALMGCYGLGVSRLMGTIVEASHDKNGIIWPTSVAPYHVVVVPLGKPGTAEYDQSFLEAEKLERSLEPHGIEVLVDDRSESPGKRFADADLIGIPLRIVISPRTLGNKSVEWKERNAEKAKEVSLHNAEEEVLKWFQK